MTLKERIECKHGIRKNSGYACATCLTGSKYTIKRKYTKKRDKTNLKEQISSILLAYYNHDQATQDILKAVEEDKYKAIEKYAKETIPKINAKWRKRLDDMKERIG